MATFIGTDHDDVLIGTPNGDYIVGLAGDDTLNGEAGNDTIDGGPGRDSLYGGFGNDDFDGKLDIGDTVSGDDGWDRVVGLDLSWSIEPVDIDVGSLLSLYLYDYATDAALDVVGVEQYAGVLAGHADDVLNLGFIGDAEPTIYSGGEGTDLLQLDFSGQDGAGRAAAQVTLSAAGPEYAELVVQMDDGSTLASARLLNDFELLDITGSAGNDALTAGPGTDSLDGAAGQDRLLGRGGADELRGGAGADTLEGGPGDDLLWGDAGRDVLRGDAGFDLAVYRDEPVGVVIDLRDSAIRKDAVASDVLRSIEGVVGTLADDRLTGDDLANRLYGAYGADTIAGMGGDDFIAADGGPVFIGQYTPTTATTLLLGGDGNDTIWGDTRPISTVDPGYYQPAIIRGGAGNDELYNGLEVSAGSGNDYVYGGNIDSTIEGGAGDDEIEATYGDHLVFGGVGRDLVWTEALHGGTNTVDLGDGNDIGAVFSYDPQFAHRFDGGDGVDRFLFEDDNLSFTTRVVIDLQDTIDGAIGHIGTIAISNFECLTLLLAVEHDDIIRLDDFDDYVDASDGDDLVVGRGGADYLEGGYGEDTILGGQGNDVVIAGPSPGNVHEKVRGGAGDDVVYGNFSAADYAGEALLYGDAGRDVFSFLPTGIVTPDRVKDFDPVDDYVSIYMGAYYFVEPTSHEFDQLVPIDLADTDSELRFTYRDRVDDFNVHTIEVVYDRGDGTLKVHDIESPGADEILVCTFAGAPALHIEHFLTMPEFYGPDSVGAEYYGGDAASGDALALAQSLWSAGATAHTLFVDGAP